jgi:membrane fusion protein (multidrug efflux system)
MDDALSTGDRDVELEELTAVSSASTVSEDDLGAPAKVPGRPLRKAPRRILRRLVLPMGVVAALVLLVAGLEYWEASLGVVKTDNAQTQGDLAPISSRIPGTVVNVNVVENQRVTAGTVLVELDATDYRLALDHATLQLSAARAQVEAARAALAAQQRQFASSLTVAQAALQVSQPRLSQAEVQVRIDETTTAAQLAQAQARVATADSEVQATKTNLDVAGRTLERDRSLLAQGAVPAQLVDTDTAAYEAARARYQAAQDALRQAQAGLTSADAARQQVQISRQSVAVNKAEISRAEALVQQAAAGEALIRQRAEEVAAAEARAADSVGAVRIAEVNLERTIIRAPVDGWVTNRTVQIGQVVQPNQPLMGVALARHVWVVANIKETQINKIRVGDHVRITVDASRGHVLYGHVESIGAATGATTALLPPDNATGNFIKVVQLVPVRIALDVDPGPGPALQIGLSAQVTIDVQRKSR